MTFNNKHIECSKCKGTLEYGGVFEEGVGYLCSKCFTKTDKPVKFHDKPINKYVENAADLIEHKF